MENKETPKQNIPETKDCPRCGKKIFIEEEICPNCGSILRFFFTKP